MQKVENSLSSVSPKYPSFRDEFVKSGARWLEGKQVDDNAEGLWRIHDKLYDVTDFIKRHPGGAEWLEMTKGTDITEQFETHHVKGKAEDTLKKFYVREAKLPRNYTLTFKDDGFYRTLKRKVTAQLETFDEQPIKVSRVISDLVLATVFTSAILSVKYGNIFLALLSGLFLEFMLVTAHNFIHQRDNWRMFCFNLTLLNYREWRVSHAISHHMYTNSYYDMEISMFEPFLQWIPRPKTKLHKLVSPIISPLIWMVLLPYAGVLRTILTITKREPFRVDHLIPLSLPLAMLIFGKMDVLLVLKTWTIIIATCSFLTSVVGLNLGNHHHPENTHEGDEIHESMDFGIFQMTCVIDWKEVKSNHFLTLVSFGHHTLHHLFPTLDHGILMKLHGTFIETCNEFELELREYSWHKLVEGQFQQLVRDQPKNLDEKKIK